MIYFIVAMIFICFGIVEITTKDRILTYIFFVYSLIIMFFLSSLRFNTGMDWNSYYSDFFVNNINTEGLEYFYKALNDFFRLTKNYTLMLMAISSISLIPVFLLLKKSKYRILALLIFFSDLFLYLNLSGMRQGIAIGITLYSTLYIFEKKNFFKFSICILTASLFHRTALIFILAYFIPHVQLNKKNLIKIIFSIAVFIVFQDVFIESIVSLFPHGKIWVYLKVLRNENIPLINYTIGILKRIVVLILFFTIPRSKRLDHNLKGYTKIYSFGFLIYILTYTINPDIGVRLGCYFTIVDMLIVSKLLIIYERSVKKYMIFLLIALMCIYKIYGYSIIAEYNYKINLNYRSVY